MFITRIFASFFLLLILSSCDQSSKNLTELDNVELRKKWRACMYIKNPSSREQQMCKNYGKECNDRKNEDNLACY